MRIAGWGIVVLALAAGPAIAQQEVPALQDGPLQVPAAKPNVVVQSAPTATGFQATAQAAPASPDAEGVFSAGPGIVLPRLVDPEPLNYPADAPLAEPPRNCVLELVVGPDGTPSEIKVVRSLIGAADGRASELLAKSHFEPGTLDGKPVPVRIDVSFHFFPNSDSALPRVLARPYPVRVMNHAWDKPPKLIHMVNAQFSDKARRAKLQGVVLLSLVVNEEGQPTDIQVTRPLGMGLDEKAVQAASQYEFEPATKDGKPVAAKISIEVNFRLF